MQALRTIVLKRTATTQLTVTYKREIHVEQVKYIPNVLTAKGNEPRKLKITSNVSVFTTKSGIDDIGGYSALVFGDWHARDNPWLRDRFRHVTAQIFTESGGLMYLKRDDGTIWDRIHVPEDPSSTPWNAKFTLATKTQFEEWMVVEDARIAKVKKELAEAEAAEKLKKELAEAAEKQKKEVL